MSRIVVLWLIFDYYNVTMTPQETVLYQNSGLLELLITL